MTASEQRLAAALLRLAAESYSNHSCNDFDLAPFITDARARDAMVLEAYGELFGADGRTPDYRLGDSNLMDLMADRLEAEAARDL